MPCSREHTEDLVDEPALHSYGLQMMARDMGTPRFHRYWIQDRWRDGFDPGFVAFLENQIEG